MKFLFAALLLLSLPAFAEFKVPLTPNPVNDYANVLTRGGKEKIAESLVVLKKEVGAQVGVVIVNSLEGSTIEDASLQTAKKWGLGSKDRDDGTLIFVAVKDRKMRVEVGRGLEGILTDYYSKQITTGMKPYLKVGDYDGAILSATGGILNRIRTYKTEITSKSGATTTVPAEQTSGNGGIILFGILALLGIGGFVTVKVRADRKQAEEDERLAAEARKISRTPPTAEQLATARLMYQEVKEKAKTDPAFPKRNTASVEDEDESGSGFGTGLVVGSILGSGSSSSSDDSGGSFGGFGGGDSGGGFSGSDFGGGGGDFGGGGSSDSF